MYIASALFGESFRYNANAVDSPVGIKWHTQLSRLTHPVFDL